jgi:hypothetical protein
MKVVRLSALRTGRLNPLGNIPGTGSVDHSAWCGRKDQVSDPTGNRNRDQPACSAGPKPTAPPRALR